MGIGMEFKNIAITGHTSGIGKGLYEYFISKGCNVKGFSKDSGFDISNKLNQELIISSTKECELFINNAYHHYAQVELMKLWQQHHWNNNHFIINTSSMAAEPLADIPNTFPWLTPYGKEKYEINKN
jgi:hypothetical protein